MRHCDKSAKPQLKQFQWGNMPNQNVQCKRFSWVAEEPSCSKIKILGNCWIQTNFQQSSLYLQGKQSLSLQKQKLIEKVNTFFKQACMNLRLSDWVPTPHLQDEDYDLLCLKPYLNEKADLMSPSSTKYKPESTLPHCWAQHRALGFAACAAGDACGRQRGATCESSISWECWRTQVKVHLKAVWRLGDGELASPAAEWWQQIAVTSPAPSLFLANYEQIEGIRSWDDPCH